MALAGFLIAQTVLVAQVTWDGDGGNNRWGRANNWGPNGVPGTGNDVLFDNSSVGILPSTIELRGNRNAATLTFDSDDTLAIVNGSGNRRLDLWGGGITQTAASGGAHSLEFGTLRLRADAVFDLQGSGGFTVSARIRERGGFWAVTKDGGGTLVLLDDNDFSGGFTVNAGTVGLGDDNAAGDGTLTLAGGIIQAEGGARTLGNDVTVTGDFQIDGANDLTLSGAMDLGASNRTVTVVNMGETTFSGEISGSGGLIKAGAGTLELAGVNTFAGNLNLLAGTLRVTADANLGDAANDLDFDGGTLQAAGTFTADADRVFTIGAGAGTIDVISGQTLTLGTAGQLAGSGSLTRTGPGTLTFAAANIGYTGETNLNAGVTRLEAFNALGTSTTATVTLNNGAELEAAFAFGTNFQSNLVINDGIIRRTDSSGTKSGFQNNNPGSSLTVNGTAQIIDEDGVGGPGGFLTLDGVVQLNTGASLTATAVNADDEIRFGGGQNITLAAGSTLKTAGAGRVSFGSGSARTLIGEGTTASEATVSLGAADHTSNAGSSFQVDGSGLGGLRLEGGQTIMDSFVTDTRLAATTGTGGALTLAYTDASVRTLGAAANLTTASGVLLALETNGGNLTLGAGSGDLDNWGGLVVKGADTTVTFGADQVFDPGASLTLAGGTLVLDGTTQAFDSLTITADSVIDFGGSAWLSLNSLSIATGITLTITNWADTVNFLYTQSFVGTMFDDRGGAGVNQVVFDSWSGSDTIWQEYDQQVTPVPEPATYGTIMVGLGLLIGVWRRWRTTRQS